MSWPWDLLQRVSCEAVVLGDETLAVAHAGLPGCLAAGPAGGRPHSEGGRIPLAWPRPLITSGLQVPHTAGYRGSGR